MSINAVAPLAGAWIEIDSVTASSSHDVVAPLAGAWIEMTTKTAGENIKMSLPSRERGLKWHQCCSPMGHQHVAPLAGAWIEIQICF